MYSSIILHEVKLGRQTRVGGVIAGPRFHSTANSTTEIP